MKTVINNMCIFGYIKVKQFILCWFVSFQMLD